MLASAIEAFVLGPSPDAFLREAAAHLRPGGKLIVVDDFLSTKAAGARPRERRYIEDFRYGWMVSSLVTVAELAERASPFGRSLTRDEDLTPYLELRRPRDLLLSAAVALGRPLRIPGYLFRSWVGGNGLQLALCSGVLDYRFVVLTKR